MSKNSNALWAVLGGLLTFSYAMFFGAGSQPPSDLYPSITSSAIIKDVYDGDTITVTFYKEVKIRMLDCWAKELRSSDPEEKQKAIEAREFLKNALKNGDKVLIRIPTTDRLQDSLTFGRALGHVWKDLDGDGKLDNISDYMVKNGHATKNKEKR